MKVGRSCYGTVAGGGVGDTGAPADGVAVGPTDGLEAPAGADGLTVAEGAVDALADGEAAGWLVDVTDGVTVGFGVDVGVAEGLAGAGEPPDAGTWKGVSDD